MKYRLALGVTLILQAGVSHALTLGQIQVESYINEPLRAAIEIRESSPAELQLLTAKLASKNDFDRVGVEWNATVGQVRIQFDENSVQPRLLVTTLNPVIDPFISFVVDVAWSTGNVIKDYTVLLDPPIYSMQQAAPIEPILLPSEHSKIAKAKEQDASQKKQEQSTSQAGAVKSQPATKQATSKTLPATKNGDSLWKIAVKVKPEEATIQQALVSLHEANPDAFYGGNMNQLKSGQILNVPDEESIKAISKNAAIQRVARHEKAWKAGTAIASNEKPLMPVAPLSPEPETAPAESGRVQLASAGETANDAVGTSTADGAAGPANTSALKEELVSSQQESEDLRMRLQKLEDQLAASQELIKLKDDQLAQLQAYYRRLNEENRKSNDGMRLESSRVASEPAQDESIETEPESEQVSKSISPAISAMDDAYNLDKAMPESANNDAETDLAGDEEPAVPMSPIQEETLALTERAAATSQGIAEPVHEISASKSVPEANAPTTEPVSLHEQAQDESRPESAVPPVADVEKENSMLSIYGGAALALIVGLFVWLRRKKNSDAVIDVADDEDLSDEIMTTSAFHSETDDQPVKRAENVEKSAAAITLDEKAERTPVPVDLDTIDAESLPDEPGVTLEEIDKIAELEAALDEFENELNAKETSVTKDDSEETLGDMASLLDIKQDEQASFDETAAAEIDKGVHLDPDLLELSQDEGIATVDFDIEPLTVADEPEVKVPEVEEQPEPEKLVDFKPTDVAYTQESIRAAEKLEADEAGPINDDILDFNLDLDEEEQNTSTLSSDEPEKGQTTEDVDTMIDLARAFAEMGDLEGAKEMLQEALEKGTDEQKQTISDLMPKLLG